jgi:hypothetical protein
MSFQRPSFWHYRANKKVGYRSPADGVLQRGDIISKIGNYDARDIRHQDAQTLFANAGNSMKVVVQRDNSLKSKPAGSAGSSNAYSPLSVSPHLSPRGGANFSSPSAYSPGAHSLEPYHSLPFTPLDHLHFNIESRYNHPKMLQDADKETHVTNQPYRTTPLVLPGAKVKRDAGHTESYLRHHPNPNVRSAPHHLTHHDQYLKQKVADSVLQRIQKEDPSKQIVHKQFNSPISLYSDGNIADTLYKQTGIPAARKVAKPYNPEESETYRAVKEDCDGELQEISAPPTSKVFTPNRVPPAKKPGPVYSLPSKQQNNVMGEDEIIHQSGSFKRLMWSVMSD